MPSIEVMRKYINMADFELRNAIKSSTDSSAVSEMTAVLSARSNWS